MTQKVVIKAEFMLHDRLGRLVSGDVVELPERQAKDMLESGAVEYYQTKVTRDRPYQAVGAQLSASQAALVSQQTIAKKSKRGATKTKKTEG